MLQHAHKTIISVILLAVQCIVLAGNCSAEDLTVKLVINPKKTDVYLGSAPIALTAKARGKNLTFKWELIGPGKLEGKSSAMFYTLPEKIEGTSAQALITVIVTDETGQELRESVTFNILPRLPTSTPTPKPTPTPIPAATPTAKRGMRTSTKIALGAGAVAALGGGIALAVGGGDDTPPCVTECAGVMVGCYCWYLGALGESCTQVCVSHGGYHEATRTYAGSDGTNDNCKDVLDALGVGDGIVRESYSSDSGGCYYHDWEAAGGTDHRSIGGGTRPGQPQSGRFILVAAHVRVMSSALGPCGGLKYTRRSHMHVATNAARRPDNPTLPISSPYRIMKASPGCLAYMRGSPCP